ncbi:Imm59 family immunity protein [Listeria costaricensis]|uniref:Imm59 family immunity protein n=1 Tax=Listeria costaricensis TaxID=2026604 RepID=UPI000C068F32|nr:Imm59 family immunity protein [Listeria costaricensis]
MKQINEKKNILTQKVKELGYSDLRVCIFNLRDENRTEWQTRIEFDNETGVYKVYSLADRASLMGKIESFNDYQSAEERFLRRLKLTVEYNKLRVSRNELPEYSSPLWDEE